MSSSSSGTDQLGPTLKEEGLSAYLGGGGGVEFSEREVLIGDRT